MRDFSQTAVVVLAAGLSTRFGPDDKLAAILGDRPLSHHILETLSGLAFSRRILVCRGQAWTRAFQEAGFELVHNREPEKGMSGSLRLGCSAASDCRQILVCLADMPFVTRRHLLSLAEAFDPAEGRAVASSGGSFKGPPAIFDADRLRSAGLAGDQGARSLLKDAIEIPAAEGTLADIDRLQDLL